MNKNHPKISDFILEKAKTNQNDLVALVAEKYKISRQRAHNYVTRQVKKGSLIKVGKTRSTRYFPADGNEIEFSIKIEPSLAEDQVWLKYVKPLLLKCSRNILNISDFGFTEIFNNAIDHSQGTSIYSKIKLANDNLTITIMDNGVGIYKKIQEALQIESIKESILHLSKGKFTTDPSKHTGEGIFFASRMFDRFSILSSDLYYSFQNQEWFLSPEKNENFGKGTCITMTISLQSKKTTKEIFDQYAGIEIGFWKTKVAVALSADPNDPHVSRSQAKRLLIGLEKFKSIILDFKNVESVGQAFVDEVFRVFQNKHIDIDINYVNANDEVESMIKRGLATR
ncbi:STAS-like domain-containing protein [Patescibacteria group bacterium]